MSDVVGRVLGTDEATPLEFWVAVADGAHLQLDDVVALDRALPNGERLSLYGIVSQVRARHEGARFDSDVFLIADGVLPAEVAEAAQVQLTRVVPETFVPPLPGAEVRRAVGDERDAALDFDEVERRLPAGLSRDDDPIYLDPDFIDGTKGAHINISGISGVATKTSYATFLLYSLFNSGVLGAEAMHTKGLIFNVKGEDLLFLDHPNSRLDNDQRLRYSALGLEAAPFRSVVIRVPRRSVTNSANVRPFFWTIADFCSQHLLPFLFADEADQRQQYMTVVHSVAEQLALCAEDSTGADGSIQIDGKAVRGFSELVDAVEEQLLLDDKPNPRWAGRAITAATIHAFSRRLHASVRHVEHLIRADATDVSGHAIDLDSSQVTVVDIHELHDRAKHFVVGAVLRRAFEDREQSSVGRPILFVVLDELNKFAPRYGSNPVKEVLLDVAEWGRALGIILIGAQQTASEVEHRVVANSAVRIVGRLDSAEAREKQYGFLLGTQRRRATVLKPGSVYLSQPLVPVPLLIEFPFPAWATRPAEARLSGDASAVDPAEPPIDGRC